MAHKRFYSNGCRGIFLSSMTPVKLDGLPIVTTQNLSFNDKAGLE